MYNVFIILVLGFIIAWWIVNLSTSVASGKPVDDPFSAAKQRKEQNDQ